MVLRVTECKVVGTVIVPTAMNIQFRKIILKFMNCYLNKIVFTSQTHLLFLYVIYYSGNMFRLAIESSSGPYIKIQILKLF